MSDHSLDSARGFCRRIESSVNEGQCINCFTAPNFQGLSRREKYGTRTLCVKYNIQDLPEPDLTGEDLNALAETSLRHILGNATMIAQTRPHEATAQTLLREIRLHLGRASRTGGP